MKRQVNVNKSKVTRFSSVKRQVTWVGEDTKVLGALKNMWKERSLSFRAFLKMGVFDGRVVLLVLYICNDYVNVLKFECLMTMSGMRGI